MLPTDKPSPSTRTQREWSVTYSQRDVDAIREQIEQAETGKRRWLVLVLTVVTAALAGSLVLLSTSYGLYSKSESNQRRLQGENQALKGQADQCQQQMEALSAEQARDKQMRTEAQARLDKFKAEAATEEISPREAASFAQMVYNLPERKVELTRKPSDSIFRNWKVKNGSTTEVYTLVGGFVDGKWVVYSDLVARK